MKSKKLAACIIGIVTVLLSWVLSKLGMPVPTEQIGELVALLVAYIVGQGAADFGKERARLEMEQFKVQNDALEDLEPRAGSAGGAE